MARGPMVARAPTRAVPPPWQWVAPTLFFITAAARLRSHLGNLRRIHEHLCMRHPGAPLSHLRSEISNLKSPQASPPSRHTALALGERVARDGVFTSRRGSGEGVSFADAGRTRGMACAHFGPNRPLTRRPPAGKSAGGRHPLPKGEGRWFWLKERTRNVYEKKRHTLFALALGLV
jgi:hypothetical protein